MLDTVPASLGSVPSDFHVWFGTVWNLLRCLFVCRVSTHNERDASPLGYAAGFGYRANREGSAWKAVGGLQQRNRF